MDPGQRGSWKYADQLIPVAEFIRKTFPGWNRLGERFLVKNDPLGPLEGPVIMIVIIRRPVTHHFAPVEAQHELNSEILLAPKARRLFSCVLSHEVNGFG